VACTLHYNDVTLRYVTLRYVNEARRPVLLYDASQLLRCFVSIKTSFCHRH